MNACEIIEKLNAPGSFWRLNMWTGQDEDVEKPLKIGNFKVCAVNDELCDISKF